MRILLLSLLFTFSLAVNDHIPNPLSDDFINHINSLKSTWRAGRNFDENTDLRLIKNLMGTLELSKHLILPKRDEVLPQDTPLPESFDARQQWPSCSTIGDIRDQGQCGSCWAVAVVEAMSDRLCIHSQGKINVRLSARDVLSCCTYCGYGCDGGMPFMAWEYWTRSGIVTGGEYDGEGCQPYPFPSCEHHTDGSKPPCNSTMKTPECVRKCQTSYPKQYYQDLYYGKSSYNLQSNQEDIMREIYYNGPVVGMFDVYEDFVHYKEGVYQYVAGKYLGGHAIKILGWGVEENTPYWLVANSWNADWGNKGYFKILRGKNHLAIESLVSAGMPRDV